MVVVTELPGKQTRVYTRKCQVHLTDAQVAIHDRALAAANKLHNYALTKLECRFGLAPGTRSRLFPTGKWLRAVLTEIRLAFARDEYGLTRWSWRAIGLSAQMAEAQLVKLATNFAMYRESARSVRYLDFEHRKTDDGYEYRLPGEDWKPVMAVEYLPGLEEIQLSVDYRGATLLIPEEETR